MQQFGGQVACSGWKPHPFPATSWASFPPLHGFSSLLSLVIPQHPLLWWEELSIPNPVAASRHPWHYCSFGAEIEISLFIGRGGRRRRHSLLSC